MKRVLICGFTDNVGGMESYVMNIYRRIDRTQLQFDFIDLVNGKMAYSDEIRKLGGNIITVPQRRDDLKKHNAIMNELFQNTKYEGIYYQCNRRLRTLEFFKLAKKYNVPKRVIHSHNTQESNPGTVANLRIALCSKTLNNYVTDRWACSEDAGKWMFNGSSYTVINNGVDTEKYAFDEKARKEIRESYNALDHTVLGTVGRISPEKNPDFLVDLFSIYHKENPNSIFLHIGDGELVSHIKEKISDLGLSDSYLLLGRKSDVDRYINAMDAFLLPSIHEGFPIVLVEAQANGLRCMVSDKVTSSTDLTGLVEFLPINDPKEWADSIGDIKEIDRSTYSEIIREKKYSINDTAKQVFDFFISDK